MTIERIIAIETSCRRGSVALGRGDDLIATAAFSADMQHARELLPTVARLCDEQGWPPDRLDACFLSIGPGSFTGLRVGVTFARHLALAAGVRLCAVPTLDVIAANCTELDPPPPRLAVILDAKRGQVYASVFEYEAGRYAACGDAAVVDPAELFRRASGPLAVTGEGVDRHREAVESAGATVIDAAMWMPMATRVLQLGRALSRRGGWTAPRELIPHYLRRPEAEEVWERRHADLLP